MEPYSIETVVREDGTLLLPAVPFAPGTKVVVTVDEADPMDREAFEAALHAHYGSRNARTDDS